jgi:hypothetical protein
MKYNESLFTLQITVSFFSKKSENIVGAILYGQNMITEGTKI